MIHCAVTGRPNVCRGAATKRQIQYGSKERKQNMEFSREKLKQIRRLMILAAFLVLMILYSEKVFFGAAFLFGILKPFLYGGAIAFVLNIPMRAVENKWLKGWNGKASDKLKRPVSMVITLVLIALVLAIVVGVVLPQMALTISEIGKKIPAFIQKMMEEFGKLTREDSMLADQLNQLDLKGINWNDLLENIMYFMRNGAGNMLGSTFNVAGSIISGVVNTAIAFVFALYILAQKEKLASQAGRLINAYLPARVRRKVRKAGALLDRNFSNFIAGQCLEALILGVMFIVSMSIFRMPYAFTVGALIAVTSLIPIVGAFTGCAVGTFLILVNDPLQALWFLILFFVLQQIEGNLIYPRVVGNSVGLPSIWVLMAVSIGGSLFGVTGMLVFIPLMSTEYALIRENVNRREVLAEKGVHLWRKK